MADRDRQIRLKVEDIVKEAGAELLELKVNSFSGKNVVHCVVDLPEGGITLGSCATINKKVVVSLEENDSLNSNCTVEVNSPGLDRKLHTFKDFFKTKGRNISIWLSEPVEGKEYLEGQVLAVVDDELSLECKDKILKISFNKIKVGKEKI